MRLAIITHEEYDQHITPPGHPERPQRLQAIREALRERGAFDKFPVVAPQPVEWDLLAQVHRPEYIRLIEQAARRGGGMLDPDTAVSPKSYEIALLAAGGAVEAVRQVMEGRVQCAMALVRPPGHHALPERAMGFCLFNNVAVAATFARERYGVERIFLIDWDVHHGNGTQEIFYQDRSVLYLSTHQENWYPGTGSMEEVGAGDGEGFTVNIPLPEGTGDEGYRHVFEEVILPLGDAFKPQLVLISAGYDSHYRDPLGRMLVTAEGFRSFAAWAREIADRWAGGRVVALLEGGYDLDGLVSSVLATIEAFSGESLGVEEKPPEAKEVPYWSIRERVGGVRKILLAHWNL
ncbi:MAG: histone deacetylase [Armatimonadota bacterium]|nr:histone deacetylase [Armatimonadota bacterium]